MPILPSPKGSGIICPADNFLTFFLTRFVTSYPGAKWINL
jgi:hypothetical protein